MSQGPLIARFFDDEVDEHVIALILGAARTRTAGLEYFTFNVFNVRLDFDTRVATVEDELNPTSDESMALEAFIELVEAAGRGDAQVASADA